MRRARAYQALLGLCVRMTLSLVDVSRIMLASGSPRRQELLKLAGWEMAVLPAEVEEKAREHETGRELTRRLARSKAQATPSVHGAIVLAADTIVVDGEELLGKPVDSAEARHMLERLRGRKHVVVTSLALQTPDGTLVQDTCESTVSMRDYSQEEIDRYLASGRPLDKAGAYGIQDGLFEPVEVSTFQDCFANVMGLPLCHVVRSLRRIGVEPKADVPAACIAHTGYDCHVYPAILAGDA
ncbi:MAG TPA: nucleoside triphosphate pyrophosphatase [Anaerolineales bacterium]|nr:nucleoside triphosphate pyrophosphatase [Anaerolineales bacterium]